MKFSVETSSKVSSFVWMPIGWLVMPGLKVTVPVSAVKSPGATAVPFAVAYWTVTVCSLAGESVTVKFDIAPSTTALAFEIESCGATSLSLIDPVPVLGDPSAAFTGLESATLKASPLASSTESSLVEIATGWVVTPGLKVRVPASAS